MSPYYFLLIIVFSTLIHYAYKIYLSSRSKRMPFIRNRLLRYVASIQIEDMLAMEPNVPQEIQQARKMGYDKLKKHAGYMKQLYTQNMKKEGDDSEPTPESLSQPFSSLVDGRFGLSSCVPFYLSNQVTQDLQYPMWVQWTQGVQVGHTKESEKSQKHAISYDLTGSFGLNVAGHDTYRKWLSSSFGESSSIHITTATALGSLSDITCDNIQKLTQISKQECVSFHNSGTEAVMAAVRLARFNTGKPYVIVFQGAYHGWWDALLQASTTQHNGVLTLKDMNQTSLDYISYEGLKIAAVIVNPMQAFAPNTYMPVDAALVNTATRTYETSDRFQQYKQFLHKLRQICSDVGTCLIFDEVYSGFRISRFGAQQLFDVQADIVCYGKTVGGGLPVGIICGSRQYMRKSDPRYLFRRADVYGTFAASPAVMHTMNHFLNWITQDSTHELYETKYQLFNEWAISLNTTLSSLNVPVQVSMWNTLFSVCFTRPSHYHWLFQYYLRKHSLYVPWTGTGRLLLSLDYDRKELQMITDKFVAAVKEMEQDGWWYESQPMNLITTLAPRILYKSLTTPMIEFWDEIEMHKRIDDEVAHKHPVNQMFHVISSMITLTTYIMFGMGQIWWPLAVLLNLISQTIRQSGHFFFERSPPGAERAKIGFDTMHKKVLCGLGALFYMGASMNQEICDFLYLGNKQDYMTWIFFINWLVCFFIAAFLSKAILIMNQCNIRLGILWTCKILTDPFTDIYIYGGSFKRVYYRYIHAIQHVS